MASGILIFGSSGSGTTTLGRAVAERLGFAHVDLDDYLWQWDTDIPFTVTRPRAERTRLLLEALSDVDHFVMSGSMDSYNAPFVPMFDLAVLHTAPVGIRLARLQAREAARLGARILPGGDMAEQHRAFLETASRYDGDASPSHSHHEQWAATLPCPVLHTDGTRPVEENAALVSAVYRRAAANRGERAHPGGGTAPA